MSDSCKTAAAAMRSLLSGKVKTGKESPMQPHLEVIALVVEDMTRSLAFYRQLGLDVPPEADREPHVEAPIGGDLRLAWDTVDTIRSFDPEWQRPTGGPGVGLAFRCETEGDVDATYETLVSLGHEGHMPPWDAFWGQRYASLRDPDGNAVDLYCPKASD
jgi:uncharacterized glyoxalase superfamily protein PhnB